MRDRFSGSMITAAIVAATVRCRIAYSPGGPQAPGTVRTPRMVL
jgi:hypothetical protein